MRRPIRYKPKDPVTLKKPNAIKPIRTTLKARPRPTMIKPTRTTLKAKQVRPTRSIRSIKKPSPNLFNMQSANMLYDPRQPSPKIQINSNKLFDKIRELQEMLNAFKRKRVKNVSMNRSAKEYLNKASYEDPLLDNDLNFASYEDPLLDNDLKLKGVKGTAFG
jgi:hypothetical protein